MYKAPPPDTSFHALGVHRGVPGPALTNPLAQLSPGRLGGQVGLLWRKLHEGAPLPEQNDAMIW